VKSKHVHLVIVALILLAAVATATYAWPFLHRSLPKPLRICTPAVPFASAIVLSDQAGLFVKEDLEVETRWTSSGRAAMDMLVAGHCDLIVCRETPLVLAFMRKLPVVILASIATSEDSRSILVRRDRGIFKIADLRGKKVGCVPETSSDYVLDNTLDSNGMALNAVERVYGSPEEIERAMIEGGLDAISIWAPIGDRVITALNGSAELLATDVVPRAYWNVVVRVGMEPELAQRALRALQAGGMLINTDIGAAAKRCSPVLGIPPDELRKDWSQGSFSIQLDQALVVTLESHARWAMLKGYVPLQPIPNFLDAIAPLPLVSVDPQLVTVVHPAVK
jgi:sulfonate transport system substrate-binding protein